MQKNPAGPGGTIATLSDAAIAEVQRMFASVTIAEEPRSPPPRRRTPRRLVILDSTAIRVRLRTLGLTPEQLAERLRVFGLEKLLLDYGELKPKHAARLAEALGVSIDEITYGMRTP